MDIYTKDGRYLFHCGLYLFLCAGITIKGTPTSGWKPYKLLPQPSRYKPAAGESQIKLVQRLIHTITYKEAHDYSPIFHSWSLNCALGEGQQQ